MRLPVPKVFPTNAFFGIVDSEHSQGHNRNARQRMGREMSGWLSVTMRFMAMVCMVVFLLLGSGTVGAQSTMDPSLDSDGDGDHNGIDFDDDNDFIADDEDCAPFDATIGRECPTAPDTGTDTGQQVPSDPTPPPSGFNPPSGSDHDGDGIEDRVDPDDDNDGITDEQDAAPFDPAVGSAPPVSIIDREEDSDGDGIANSHDPDDDNDGVQDDQDSHPFDPTRGEKPGPSIISPDHDSDGDGIANSHDPDDDNDGVIDELDCAPFDPTITACPPSDPTPAVPEEPGTIPTRPDPSAPGGGGGAGPRRAGGGGALFVTTLPSTGVAVGAPDNSVPLALIVAALGLAASGTGVLVYRCWRCAWGSDLASARSQ